MGRRYHDSVEICGQLVRSTAFAIVQLLAKSQKPLHVLEIGDGLLVPLEDNEIYQHMKRISQSGQLVTASVIESKFRGKTQKRAAWEATPAVKEFFSKQEVTQ